MQKSTAVFGFFFNASKIVKILGWKFLLFLMTIWSAMNSSQGDYLFVLTLSILLITIRISSYYDKIFWKLLFFSIIYSLFIVASGQLSSTTVLLGYILGPVVLYSFGQYIVEHLHKEDLIITALWICLIVFIIPYAFLVFSDIKNFGFVNIARTIQSQSSGGTIAATLYGLVASVGFGGAAAFIALPNKLKDLTPWLFLSLFLVSIIMTIHLVNRSGLYVTVFTTLVVVQYISRFNILKLFLFLMGIMMLFIVLEKYDIINQTVISAYNYREEQTETNSRFDRWEGSLRYLFAYPFGWSTYTNINMGYAHNMWLDVARKSGLIPFGILVSATIDSLLMVKKLFFVADNKLVVIFLCVYTSIFCAVFVEPALDACPYIFYLFVMIWGMMKKYMDNVNMKHICKIK